MLLPKGPLDGAVDLEIVKDALREQGVGIVEDGDSAILFVNHIVIEQHFSDPVPREVLQVLWRNLGLEYVQFYYDGDGKKR